MNRSYIKLLESFESTIFLEISKLNKERKKEKSKKYEWIYNYLINPILGGLWVGEVHIIVVWKPAYGEK